MVEKIPVPRITYLRVRNYRVLRDVELKDISPLTVLLGPNGSGKSTLFDVFAFLSECFTEGLRRAWDRRGRFREMRSRGADGPIEMAWFFGDFIALTEAYSKVSSHLGDRSAYRTPDAIKGGTWEALHRELKKAGYDMQIYPKIDVARRIASHMVPFRNTSPSFQAFRLGLEALLST